MATTIMPTDADVLAAVRLQTWLSPAFPTGAFAFSGGLEAAAHDGLVERDGLRPWLVDLVEHGPAWNDAVLLAEAWRAPDPAPAAKLALALAASRGRSEETVAQGRAFRDAAAAWGPLALPDPCPLPVAVGAVARRHAVPLHSTLAAFLHAFASNAVQAALRLLPLGQGRATALLASLEDAIVATARRAVGSTLDDLGSATVLADIAAMRHETLPSRIFRT